MENYIKLNNNKNHLSLGNLFNEIKSISINKEGAIQTEIFCILFNIDNISDTTVNNYCTGYRAIGSKYKQIYLNYRKHYTTNKLVFIDIIDNLISIMEGTIYNIKDISIINKNKTLIQLCHNLHILVKNDLYVPTSLKKELLQLLNSNNYYEFLINILFFTILEKKQPLYNSDLVESTIEEILDNTNMSIIDLKKYLSIEFKEGISLIPSLVTLANSNNPYALNRLGNMEYNGLITGYKRVNEAYNYFKKAAEFNHPTSCFMIAHILLNKEIGSLTPNDINLMWQYLKKAESLNSISAINTIGLCYLHGYTKDSKKDLNKAIKYFEKAASNNYIYAYNNLAKIYEEQKDYSKAISYYQKSADNLDSWSCNKMGLFYYEGIHLPKDDSLSFKYFTTGANAPIQTRVNWNIYNLVKLFYLQGNSTLGIKKDLAKSLELLNTIKNFPPSNELFLYIYYDLYLTNPIYLDKVNYYLSILDNTLDTKKKKQIETNLKEIKDYHIKIDL